MHNTLRYTLYLVGHPLPTESRGLLGAPPITDSDMGI